MAIIQYVREKHPNSKIVEEHIKYRLEGFYFIITGASPDCYITFGEDGFQYRVFADEGKVYSDSYSQSKFSNDIKTLINENFLIPRGIKNVDIHCTFDLDDDEHPNDWSEYNGEVSIYMEIVGHGDTPYEVGWLYDFYKFWCENQKFLSKWYINFRIGKQCAFYVGYDEKIDNAAQMYEKAFPKYN